MSLFFYFFVVLASSAPPELPDILLRGATVYDGSGTPGVVRDVTLKKDRIQAVGTQLPIGPNTEVIDVTGLILAPGFIDLHTHSDEAILQPRTRNNLNYLMQGVTTIVTGNCGVGPVYVKEYYASIDKNKAGSNVCHLMPHNAIKKQVMGNVNRPPTPAELMRMTELVESGMKQGAWGLSTGLYYNPGAYAQLDELVTLSEVVAKYRGFYASHIRDEGEGLLASIEEALSIGQRARLPVHLSHLKSDGRINWGQGGAALSRLKQARQQGQQVTCDQYPYLAASTSLQATVIPLAFREGTTAELVARFHDAKVGPTLRTAIRQRLKECDNGRDIRIARFPTKPAWQGKDLATISATEKKDIVDLVVEIETLGGAQIVHFCMHEEDVRLILKQDFVATASDGSAKLPDDSVPHPRNYGTFSRKIGQCGIEERLISMEQAIRSASGLPADILQLPQRGYVKAGYIADLVIFDPETYRDRATYDKPHQYSTGVVHLFIQGVKVIEKQHYTGVLAGQALRHSSVR